MQLGFFDKKETKSTSSKDGKSTYLCRLRFTATTLNPKFGHTGQGKKKILLVGAANNKVEDDRRKHWQGSDGKILENQISRIRH